jgi:hypothetical protein
MFLPVLSILSSASAVSGTCLTQTTTSKYYHSPLVFEHTKTTNIIKLLPTSTHFVIQLFSKVRMTYGITFDSFRQEELLTGL